MKDKIDSLGAISLISFSGLLGINQVLIKLSNNGIDPIFSAGARSLLALPFLGLWMLLATKPIQLTRNTVILGLSAGIIFAVEFFFLYLALDHTTVVRSSIIFYSMPVWLSIMSHFWFANDKLTNLKLLGLILSLIGIAWAMISNTNSEMNGYIKGDLLALAASILWALIALISKGTNFRYLNPETQLFWMLAVSFPILFAFSMTSEMIIRDFKSYHILILIFQSSIVVAAGFGLWFWLLSVYPASSVASFAFLAPIFGIIFGSLFLGEQLSSDFLIGAILVIVGIFFINYNKEK